MDVDTFIQKYRPDWEALDRAVARGFVSLTRGSGDQVDHAIRLYLRVSGHLAEARTRLGDPTLVEYLNKLVRRAHGAIYGGRSGSVRAALGILGSRYRLAIRDSIPFILISGGLFVIVVAGMTLWVAGSDQARLGLLPPGAEEAIQRFGGQAADFGVGPGTLSTAILLNNIQVSILGFALGITFGIGTLWLVAYNAAIIGVLAGGFEAAGKGGPFWALILPHGLLEVTAIAIACGAGLRMGWALVAPGDLTRPRSLAEAAAGSVMVLLGVAPAFVLAGLIEGYVTGSELPDGVQLLIGVVAWLGYLAFLAGGIRGLGRRPSQAAQGLDPEVGVRESGGQPPRRLVHDRGSQVGKPADA